MLLGAVPTDLLHELADDGTPTRGSIHMVRGEYTPPTLQTPPPSPPEANPSPPECGRAASLSAPLLEEEGEEGEEEGEEEDDDDEEEAPSAANTLDARLSASALRNQVVRGGEAGASSSSSTTTTPTVAFRSSRRNSVVRRPEDNDETERMIDLLYDEYGILRPGVDLAPLTVSKHTKLARISYVLRMLGASTVFVLDEGKFFGVLTRVAMFQVEKELFDQIEQERSPGKRRQQAADEMDEAEDGESPPPRYSVAAFAPRSNRKSFSQEVDWR